MVHFPTSMGHFLGFCPSISSISFSSAPTRAVTIEIPISISVLQDQYKVPWAYHQALLLYQTFRKRASVVFKELWMEVSLIPLILSSAADTIVWGREESRLWNLSQVDLTVVKAPAQVIMVVLWVFAFYCHTLQDGSLRQHSCSLTQDTLILLYPCTSLGQKRTVPFGEKGRFHPFPIAEAERLYSDSIQHGDRDWCDTAQH